MAVACLSLAFKFLNNQKFDFNVFLKHFPGLVPDDAINARVIKLEKLILNQI